jgi:hypothetical protein
VTRWADRLGAPWADRLGAPAGARALITARCRRCYLVAAKYWEHDGDGAWIIWSRSRALTPIEIAREATRCRNMVAGRWCMCDDPPPTLPEGDELTALVARARRTPRQDVPRVKSRAARLRDVVAPAPITIRV